MGWRWCWREVEMDTIRIWKEEMLFEDRKAAGRSLATFLSQRGVLCTALLGISRGGMPVALEVARALDVRVDIVVVKKLRAPAHPDVAIGAVCPDSTRVLRPRIISALNVSDEYVAAETDARLAEAIAMERMYRSRRGPLDVAGTSVLIVDDCLVTGATMEAAVRSVRLRGACSIVAAAPVGCRHACLDLRRVADDVFCIRTQGSIRAAGHFYLRFPSVTDAEVCHLLDESRKVLSRRQRVHAWAEQGPGVSAMFRQESGVVSYDEADQAAGGPDKPAKPPPTIVLSR